MGRSHSKADKSPTININEKAALSPRLKLKKVHEKKKQKKFGFSKQRSKMESLKMHRAHLDPEPILSVIGNDLELEVKKRMQNQLAFNSDIFVLNQMMMSVQFFANYERFELYF